MREYLVEITVPAMRGPRLGIFFAKVEAIDEERAIAQAWSLYRGGKKGPPAAPLIEPRERRRRERRSIDVTGARKSPGRRRRVAFSRQCV